MATYLMTDVVSIAPLVVTATATAVILVGLPRLLALSGVLDVPGARSSHSVPTPRGAGLALGPGALCGLFFAGGDILRTVVPVMAAGGFALLLGLADDLLGLRASRRLLGQVLLAGGALAPLAADGRSPTAVVLLTALIWIVAFTNAFNFMDGINGISAGTVIVTGACWTILAAFEDDPVLGTVGGVLAVSCIVFLPWNVPRAAIFLGDSGSYFLGTTMAVLVVISADRGAPLVALIGPLVIYLTDTGTTLVRRALRRERLLDAHREHVYQQLALGLGHVQTSLLVAGAAAATGCLGLLAGRTTGIRSAALTAIMLTVCIGYGLSPRIAIGVSR